MADKNEIKKQIEIQISKLSEETAQHYRDQLELLDRSTASLDRYKQTLKDVNNAVYEMSSSFSKIQSQLDGIVEELKNSNSNSRNIVKSFEGLRSIAQKLKNDQQGITDLNLEQLKKEQSKVKVLQEQLKTSGNIARDKIAAGEKITEQEQAILDAETANLDIIQQINKELDERIKKEEEINKKLGLTGVLLKGMSKIPIIGPLLEVNKALDAARDKAKAGGNAFQVMGAGLASVGKSLIKNLMDPLVIIGLIVKAFQSLVKLGFKLDKEIVNLQKAFYSSRVEAELLQEKFQENVDTNNVLVKGLDESLLSRKNQVEAATQLNNVMGAIGRVTDQEVQSQIKLTKQMGLSVEEGQALYVLGRQNQMTSSEVVDEIINQVKATQKQHKVLLDTKKITQEVSKISGQLRLQYGNNVKQLSAAVIQANKLGFSLEQTKKIAEGLLNFEESIENELSAELLIGRDLNLEQARLLALNGKSAEATALIAQNMGGSAGFAAMNVIQQESLAKALGMSADELANSIIHQENLGQLKEEDKKRLEEEISRLKERGEFEKAQQLERAAANGANIKSAIESLNKQEKFYNNVEKIKESLEGMFNGPAMKLAGWMVDMVKNSETLQLLLKGVAVIVGGALLVSLVKAIGAMGVLVGEAIAYAITWAVANPVKALVGLGASAAVGTMIYSETSKARSQKPNQTFAEGGIVGGNSPSGDNMKINANSGEMVLNKRQQSNLFKMLNNGIGGGGNIQLTANLLLNDKQFALAVASVEKTNSNNLGSERQLNNRNPQ